jgi:hypothetical protein
MSSANLQKLQKLAPAVPAQVLQSILEACAGDGQAAKEEERMCVENESKRSRTSADDACNVSCADEQESARPHCSSR